MTKSVAGGFVRSDAEASGGSRGTGSTSGSHAFLSRVRAFSTRGRLWLDDSDKPREEPSAGKPHARICGGEAEWPSYPTIPRFVFLSGDTVDAVDTRASRTSCRVLRV